MKAKPFFVFLLFVAFIIIFAGGAIGNTDLSPSTTATRASTNRGILAATAGNPGNSPCGSTYTVRSGDSLSRVAQVCNISMSDLLAANPSVQNPNLIQAGQKLVIYTAPANATAGGAVAAAVTRPASSPAAATPIAVTGPLSPLPVQGAVAETAPNQGSAASPSGLQPGGSIKMTVTGLPPVVAVEIAIGRVGSQPVVIDHRITDAQGQLTENVAIPRTARPGEKWFVRVTAVKSKVSVTSPPFTIGQ